MKACAPRTEEKEEWPKAKRMLPASGLAGVRISKGKWLGANDVPIHPEWSCHCEHFKLRQHRMRSSSPVTSHQPQFHLPFQFPIVGENWVGCFVAYSLYLAKDRKFCFFALTYVSCPASCKHVCCSWLCSSLDTIGIFPSTLIFGCRCHLSAVSQLSKGIVSLENLNKCYLFSDHICVPVLWQLLWSSECLEIPEH